MDRDVMRREIRKRIELVVRGILPLVSAPRALAAKEREQRFPIK